MRKTVSIKDIAAICQVSPMTVSRALRNNGAVRPSTRQRIIKVAEELGYIGNHRLGRPALPNDGREQHLEIIIGISGESMTTFHSKLLAVIEEQLSQAGRDCIVRICRKDYQQFLILTDNVRNSAANATLLIGDIPLEYLQVLLELRPQAILVDTPESCELDIPCESFSFDNIQASRLAVKHLIECGREKILLLTGFEHHFFSREVVRGYRQILQKYQLEFKPELICYSDFTAAGAYSALQKLLEEGIKFDAVFTTDEMASGVYRALNERGLLIPDDVAVCGCDGLPLGTHLWPQLTTITLDYEALGKRAVNYLLHERQQEHAMANIRLLPRLTERESTRSTGRIKSCEQYHDIQPTKSETT